MIPRCIIRYAVVVLVACLTGCGFTLRSLNDLPVPLQHLTVVSSAIYSEAAIELRQMLNSMPVPREQSHNYQLQLLSEKFSTNSANTTLTYGSQYNTVTLTYTLLYRLQTPQLKTVPHSEHTITTATSYTISNNQMLGNQSMQAFYHQQLVHQAISLVLSQLTMIKIPESHENNPD